MLMLIKNLLAHKKNALLISLIYTLLLLIVCLISLEELPEEAVKKGDKVFHFLAYILLTWLWFNTISKYFKLNTIVVIFITIFFCTIFGIIIEYLQSTFTSFRAADYKDVIANTIGVVTAAIIILVSRKSQVKNL